MIFLDQDEWLSALSNPSLTLQAFDGDSVQFTENSSANPIGSLSVDLQGGIGETGSTGLTGSGLFRGRLVADRADQLSLRFSFEGVYGFALSGLQNDNVDKPLNLSLDEIALSVGNEQFVLSELTHQNTSDLPFLGIISNELVDTFRLFHAREILSNGPKVEQFHLDALIFAEPDSMTTSQSVAQIPEPPVYGLLSLGLVGLLIGRRGIRLTE